MIRQVKKEFPGLVLANGGITSPAQAITMIEATGADGVGIARGSWGAPWIFRQTRELLTTGKMSEVTTGELLHAIRRHAELLNTHKGAHGLIEFRKHFAHFISGRPGAARLRARAVQVISLNDIDHLLHELAN